MRALLFTSVTLVASLVLVSACGGGTGGAGGTATTTTASTTSSSTASAGGSGGAAIGSLADDYCQPLAALICQRAATCGCGTILPGGQLDEAACVAGYRQKCLDAYAPVASAIAAGKAHVIADAARACVALIADSTPGCERPRGTVSQALCPMWFTADTAVGAACDFPICAEAQGVCTAGTCAARPGAGMPCPGQLCAEGLLCLGGTCVEPAAESASCADDIACAPPLHCVDGACRMLAPAASACTTDAACALGLVCDAGTCAARSATGCGSAAPCGNLTLCAASRRCATKAAAGVPCASDEACADGLWCDPTTHACAQSPGAGMACANGVLCATGFACDGDFGNCAPIPGAAEPCAFGPMGPSICQPTLGCNEGTCGPLPADGAPCTTDYRCAAGLGCDFAAQGSVCVALKDAGGACQTDRTCKPGLYCDGQVNACAPVLPTGAPCKAGNECGPMGTCIPGSGAQLQCAPRPAVGEACLFECAGSLFCAVDEASSTCAPEICKEL